MQGFPPQIVGSAEMWDVLLAFVAEVIDREYTTIPPASIRIRTMLGFPA
jgi:hypothetical protein